MSGLGEALAAVEVRSERSYTWLGAPVELTIPALEWAAAGVRRRALVQSIGLRLYNDFFTVGIPRRSQARASRRARRMAGQLSHANCGSGSFDDGWTYRRRDGSWNVVERRGLHVWVDDADLLVDGDSRAPMPGDTVAVRWAKDAPRISPGYYMALSDVGFAAPRPQPLDRFYFNVPATAAVSFMDCATRRLNDARLAFRLKVVDDPDGFDRCDTAVLVIQRRDRDGGFGHVLDLHRELREALRTETPALTLRLGRGLAFAEDPDDGRSYGAHRCDLFADAVVDAFERGVWELSDRMEVVREHLSAAGIALETPYLGADEGLDVCRPELFVRKEVERCR